MILRTLRTMFPTVVSEGCAAVILLPSLRIRSIRSPETQERPSERSRRAVRVNVSFRNRTMTSCLRTRVVPVVVRDKPAQQPQGLPSHVLRAALPATSLQSLHEAFDPLGQVRALRRGTRHLHHSPGTRLQKPTLARALFHFRAERGRLPLGEAKLSLRSCEPAPPSPEANQKRVTAELGAPPGSDGWEGPLGSLRAEPGGPEDAGQSGCYGNSERLSRPAISRRGFPLSWLRRCLVLGRRRRGCASRARDAQKIAATTRDERVMHLFPWVPFATDFIFLFPARCKELNVGSHGC